MPLDLNVPFTCPNCGEDSAWDPRVVRTVSLAHTDISWTDPYFSGDRRGRLETYVPEITETVWACCYENLDCPEGCSGLHAAPGDPTNLDGLFVCPETNSRYGYSSNQDAWVDISQYDWPLEIGGLWYATDSEAYDNNLSPCDDCGEWYDYSDLYHRDGGGFCCSCDPGEDDDDYDDSRSRRRPVPGRKNCRAAACTEAETLVYLPDEEEYICPRHIPVSA